MALTEKQIEEVLSSAGEMFWFAFNIPTSSASRYLIAETAIDERKGRLRDLLRSFNDKPSFAERAGEIWSSHDLHHPKTKKLFVDLCETVDDLRRKA